MKSKKIVALLLAVILCLQCGSFYKKNVLADNTSALIMQVLSNPQDAVLNSKVEIIGSGDVPGSITLNVSTALNSAYLDSIMDAYTKEIVSVPDLPIETLSEDDTEQDDTEEDEGENEENDTEEDDNNAVITMTLNGREVFASYSEQEIRDELDSFDDAQFPQITYSFELDGSIFKSDAYIENSGEVYAGATRVGSYTISSSESGNPVLTATLDRYVYYAAPSNVEYTVCVYLANEENISRIASCTTINNGEVFSLTFNNDNAPPVQQLARFNLLNVTALNAATSDVDLLGVVNLTVPPPYEVNGYTFTDDMFSKINLSISNYPIITPPDNDFSFGFVVECEFNEDFLEECWIACGGHPEDPTIFPNPSFNFTINANDSVAALSPNFYFKTPTLPEGAFEYLTSTDASGNVVNIGTITLKEVTSGSGIYNFNIQFYPEKVYGAETAIGVAEFQAWLASNENSTSTPEIKVDTSSSEIYVEWSRNNHPDFPNGEPVHVSKSTSNSILDSNTGDYTVYDPYLNYEMEFRANTNDNRDLRNLIIVDDLKQSVNGSKTYGLNAQSFTYTIKYADNSEKSETVILPLSDADFTKYDQPFLYLKETNDALDNTFDLFAATAPSTGLKPITEDSLANDSSITSSTNGEVFILDVGKLTDSNGEVVTNVKIELNTMLDTEAYQTYMKNSDMISTNGDDPSYSNLTFKNQAIGFYDDGGNNYTPVVSEPITSDIVNFKYFEKNGERVAGNKMHYMINAATYFLDDIAGCAYIIDKINYDQHYLLTNTVCFNEETPLPSPSVIDADGFGIDKKSYSDLTDIAVLKALWSEIASASNGTVVNNSDETKAVSYITSNEQIVIYRIGYECFNEPITLEYDTQLKPGTYGYNNIENDAMILVENKYLGGIGPGGGIRPDPIGTISKTEDVHYEIAYKQRSSSNPNQQSVTWTIKFNTAQETMDHVIVLDTFKSADMLLLNMGTNLGNSSPGFTSESKIKLSNGTELTYMDYNTFKSTFLGNCNPLTPPLTLSYNPTTNNNESCFTYYVDGDDTIIGFYIKQISVESTLDIVTKEVNASKIANNENDNKVINTISNAWCWNGSAWKTQVPVEATHEVPHAVINKIVPTGGNYNYSDGTIKWTLQANTTHLHIKDMIVTDFLPPESYLSNITGVKYNGNPLLITGITGFIDDTENVQTKTLHLAETGNAGFSCDLKVIVEKSKVYVPPSSSTDDTSRNIVRFQVLNANSDSIDSSKNVVASKFDITIETKFKESYKQTQVLSNPTSKKYTNLTTLDGIIGAASYDGSYNIVYTYDQNIGTIDKSAPGSSNPLTVDASHYRNGDKKAKDSEETLPLLFKPAIKSLDYKQNGIKYNGSIYNGTDTAHWRIVLNRSLFEGFIGATVTDKINPANKKWFVLETDTMTVSTGMLDASGTASYDAVRGNICLNGNNQDWFETLTEDGFEFIAPENKIYIIEFDTTVVTTDTLYEPDIKNTVTVDYIDGPDGEFSASKGNSTGNIAHVYGAISYLPNIYVVKSHKSTTINGNTKIPTTWLQGVTFRLEGYEYIKDASGKIVVDYSDSNKVYDRYETTASRGSEQVGGSFVSAMFPLLRVKKNVIYILTETSVGSTYENDYYIDAELRYIMVESDKTKVDFTAAPARVPSRDNSAIMAPVEVVTKTKAVYYDETASIDALNGVSPYGYEVSSITSDKYYATFVMFDTPKAKPPAETGSGMLIGHKTGYNQVTGTVIDLEGVLFGLYTNYNDARDPNNNGIALPQGSGPDGKFVFDNLAPGTYYLRELQAVSEIYDMSDMLDPADNTKINPQKIIEFTITGRSIMMDYDDGKERVYIDITNNEIVPVGEIIGYKQDDTGLALVGATFGLYPGNTTNFNTTTPLQVATSKLTTDGNAEFRFTNLTSSPADYPVTYLVRELSAPSGYTKSEKIYTVVLTGINSTNNLQNIELVSTDTNNQQIIFINNKVTPTTPGNGGGGGGGGGGTVTPPPPEVRTPIDVTPPETETPLKPITPETDQTTETTDINTDVETTPIDEPDITVTDTIVDAPVEIPFVPPVPPNLADVAESDILHPAQLPSGYSAVQVEDNIYIIYDDSGIPLGYVIVPEGMTLDDINIMDELIPFGVPVFSLTNPKTGDRINFLLVEVAITIIILCACFILYLRFKKI